MGGLWAACARTSSDGSVGSGTVSAASTLYARTDTNDTTVWSPRLRVAGRVTDEVTVESSYGLDAWTGASIDVVTAATKAIHEVRQEVTGGAGYATEDVRFGGSYRYSTENDYWSHGGTARVAVDLAQHNTTLDLTLYGARDRIARAHDPNFDRNQASYGGRLSLTQVIDRATLAQLSWDTSQVSGYQASPYRYVAVGGDGTCRSGAPFCLPETVPSERTRHALGAQVKRALTDDVSLALSYRFYFDTWGLQSQTLAPELSVLLGEHGTLSASYRYYTQDEARFYRPRYLDVATQTRWVTRDRELSAMYAHRIGVSYLHQLPLGSRASLSFALRAGGTYYRYLAFVGLTDVKALELTGLLGFDYL
ncbi:MAG: DUF3570 domain-containing protein [Polyangiales bacterium]